MKNFLGFLKWQWGRFELWQRIYIISVCTVLFGMTQEGMTRTVLMGGPVLLGLAWGLKLLIWDRAKESYQEYQKQKSNLFETIKTSDQK